MNDKNRPLMKKGDDFQSQWKHRFESFAKKNDDDAGVAGWSSTGLESRLRYFRSYFKPVRGNSGLWLDLGCGAGTYSRFLNNCGYSVIGVDYSIPSLLKARERSSEDISWVVADATSLPFCQNSFEGIICFGVTQALSDSEKIVVQVCQAIGDRGEIWIDGLNRWSFLHIMISIRNWIFRKPDRLRYEAPAVLKKLLSEQGVEVSKLYWMPIAPGNYPSIQRFIESSIFQNLINRVPLFGAIVSHSFLMVGYKSTENT